MLTVDFASDIFIGSESSGFVEVVVIISGGSSTTPINGMITMTEQTAKGEKIYLHHTIHGVSPKKFCQS